MNLEQIVVQIGSGLGAGDAMQALAQFFICKRVRTRFSDRE